MCRCTYVWQNVWDLGHFYEHKHFCPGIASWEPGICRYSCLGYLLLVLISYCRVTVCVARFRCYLCTIRLPRYVA